jgi:hypothetical protein
MGKHAGSVDSRILRRIRKMAPGTVFSPRDLASLGSRTAVASALSRYVKSGALSRPARGLYQVPETDPLLGQLKPSPDAIAKALGGRDRLKLQPAGAYAANLLGLSDQVPLKIVYLTDGSPRQLRLGRQQIVLRRTTPRNLATAGRISGLVIQALRHLGRDHVDASTVSQLRRTLSAPDRAQLARDAHLAPAWIAAVLREVAGGGRS